MKRKSLFILVLFILLVTSLVLVACNDTPPPPRNHSVTWKNYDGTVLELDEGVAHEGTPEYNGSTPTKPSTASTDYVFSGWVPQVGKIIADTTYTATFIEVAKKHTVTWKNYDGTILQTDIDVAYGTTPTYNGETPTKPATAQYTFTFDGWTETLDQATGNVTNTATFIQTINYYTVTWKNHDGTVLERDEQVAYGTIPTYNGETPTKTANGEITYKFVGWTPVIAQVVANAEYTASFVEYDGTAIPGVDPVFADDGTVEYGFYPQTHVSDETLIAQLNALKPSNVNGWYECNGDYYAKVTATVFNGESYKFDDGEAIVDGTVYWFKCEPIKWRVLANADGNYSLISTMLLDARNFYVDYTSRTIDGVTVYSNNYQHSSIRAWLNDYFYNIAFALNNSYIQQVTVDNGLTAADVNTNAYVSQNTNDKVYLPSYQDLINASWGFDTNAQAASATRYAKTTDYARVVGAWCNNRTDLGTASLYNGTFWTRTPSSLYNYTAWCVTSGGYLANYAVDGTSHCVRPCITIAIE